MSIPAFILPPPQPNKPAFRGLVASPTIKGLLDNPVTPHLVHTCCRSIKEAIDSQFVSVVDELVLTIIPSPSNVSAVVQVVAAFAPHSIHPRTRNDILEMPNSIVVTMHPGGKLGPVDLVYSATRSRSSPALVPQPLIVGSLTLYLAFDVAPADGDVATLKSAGSSRACDILISGTLIPQHTVSVPTPSPNAV